MSEESSGVGSIWCRVSDVAGARTRSVPAVAFVAGSLRSVAGEADKHGLVASDIDSSACLDGTEYTDYSAAVPQDRG
jgi:hypothetical protein